MDRNEKPKIKEGAFKYLYIILYNNLSFLFTLTLSLSLPPMTYFLVFFFFLLSRVLRRWCFLTRKLLFYALSVKDCTKTDILVSTAADRSMCVYLFMVIANFNYDVIIL